MAVFYKGNKINEIDYVDVTVVNPNNETITIDILENGTRTITPNKGYDGIESITINTNVECQGGEGLFEVIGYSSIPQYIQDDIDYSQTIYDNWDASVTNRYNAFNGDKKLVYFPLVDTSKVTTMKQMFYGCTSLQYVPELDTSNVTNMHSIFFGCGDLISLDLSSWDTSNVTDMSNMFDSCYLTSLDLSSWDTSNVTDMSSMFNYCRSLISLDLSSWDTSNVTNMSSMFNYCYNLTSLNLSSWNTSNVTTMSSMFYECGSLTSLDLSNFNTSNVTNMHQMFGRCSGLTSIEFGDNFNISKVTSLNSMFSNCENLTNIDISSWNTSKVTNMNYMLNGCYKLQRIDGFIDWTKISSYPSNFIYSNSTNGYPLRYMTIKNLGTTGTTFNFNNSYLQNWGDESDTTTYPLSVGARQSLVDSLLTYSYDRATNGLSTCTIQLHSSVMGRLTEDEIAAITAKGYTVA